MTILCNPEGAPMPEKMWLKDGRPFDASTDPQARIQLLVNGNLLLTKV